MITPAYGLTATERVLPNFALDWTTGLAQDAVDVTRAGVATFVGSNGLIQSASADTQRIDYSTGTAGLLVEESRTNLVLQSQAFGTSPWANAATNAVVTENTTTSPDGTPNADTLTPVANTGAHFIFQTITASSGNTRVYSVFAKKNTHDFIQFSFSTYLTHFVNFNLATGVVGNVNGSGTSASMVDVGNGWYRCVFVYPSATENQIRIALVTSNTATRLESWAAAGTETVFLWGAQLEAGAFPTSYIPTTTTAVTRNADVATVTGTNFSDFYNATEGTFASRFIFGTDKIGTRVALASDGTSSNYVGILGSTGGGTGPFFGIATGGVTQTTVPAPGSITENTEYSVCGAYKVNDCVGAKDGGAVAIDTTATIPTVNRLELGASAGTNFLNGHIMQVQYWPMRLTNNEVRAFSK